MTDDPRDILRAAGVECAEVEEYGKQHDALLYAESLVDYAADAILALARLVAKYKWQRDELLLMDEEEQLHNEGCIEYPKEKAEAYLDRRWDELHP